MSFRAWIGGHAAALTKENEALKERISDLTEQMEFMANYIVYLEQEIADPEQIERIADQAGAQ